MVTPLTKGGGRRKDKSLPQWILLNILPQFKCNNEMLYYASLFS